MKLFCFEIDTAHWNLLENTLSKERPAGEDKTNWWVFGKAGHTEGLVIGREEEIRDVVRQGGVVEGIEPTPNTGGFLPVHGPGWSGWGQKHH